jgi:BASS family bile acid:Na+ symporter
MNTTIFSDYILPATLAITTLGMGLSLEKKDFKYIFLYPKGIITGLGCQILILPVLAFAIASISNLPSYYRVGLVLISACPGGATSNLVTYLLKGNVALSISLTAVNSLIIQFSLPLIVNLGLITFMGESEIISLPILKTIFQIFSITVIPAALGVYIRSKRRKLADGLERPLRILLPVLLALVFAGVIFLEHQREGGSTIKESLGLFPYALLLNFLAMSIGIIISRVVKLGKRNQFTIAIEVGLQNSAMAIFVAESLLGSSKIALVAIIYSSFTFFSTAMFGWLAKKYLKPVNP